jgi:MOSC domain
MTCVDQETKKSLLEPLKTLSEFREFGVKDEAYFGAMAQDLRKHTIHVGCKIKILLDGEPEWAELGCILVMYISSVFVASCMWKVDFARLLNVSSFARFRTTFLEAYHYLETM